MSADDQNDKAVDDEYSATLPQSIQGRMHRTLAKQSTFSKTEAKTASKQDATNSKTHALQASCLKQNLSKHDLLKTPQKNQYVIDSQIQTLKHSQSIKNIQQVTPAISHPNFNKKCQPIDPARSLSDIPPPAPRQISPMMQLYGISIEHHSLRVDSNPVQNELCASSKIDTVNKLCSPWDLIDSPALASYLELLKAGGLISLPNSFYCAPKPEHAKPLLKPLYPLSAQASALDMSDIHAAMRQYPQLTRYGLKPKYEDHKHRVFQSMAKPAQRFMANLDKLTDLQQLSIEMPEMLNDGFAPDWEVILYPERFDNGIDSLATDLLACRLAVHVLEQCDTRQSMNRSLCAQQICQYMRSYLLSQCRLSRRGSEHYRQIRLYAGHVIVAAIYLGWQIQISEDNCVYFAISSRSALFTRYPNLFEYYSDGWH